MAIPGCQHCHLSFDMPAPCISWLPGQRWAADRDDASPHQGLAGDSASEPARLQPIDKFDLKLPSLRNVLTAPAVDCSGMHGQERARKNPVISKQEASKLERAQLESCSTAVTELQCSRACHQPASCKSSPHAILPARWPAVGIAV